MADRSTVIVTGGAEFIGSELVRQLAARGERVVIIDNLVNGKRENVADVLSRDVTLQVVDVRDGDAVVPHLREARIVFHLACLGAALGALAPRKPRCERDGDAHAIGGGAARRCATLRVRVEFRGVWRRGVHADSR